VAFSDPALELFIKTASVWWRH